MNPDSQEFEQLRRLFAIKRHEQPPPGYFHNFSRDVIARIKAGEQGDSVVVTGWLQRFWAVLESKPVFAGAFGASVCAVLISGLLNSENDSASDGAFNPVISQVNSAYAPPSAPASVMALNENPVANPALPIAPAADTASLNSLFDFQGTVQPASLNFQTGN